MVWLSRSVRAGESNVGPEPWDLHLQLLIGHAAEAVFLVRGRQELDKEDLDSLNEAAELVSAAQTARAMGSTHRGVADGRGAVRDAMIDAGPWESPEVPPQELTMISVPDSQLVRIAMDSLSPATDADRAASELSDLGSKLLLVAEGRDSELDLSDLLNKLRAMHDVLVARTSMSPDEVVGLASR